MRRRIMYVTGSRSEFELMSSTLAEISKSSSLELVLVVTGTHLLKSRGYTIDEIKKRGFLVSKSFPILVEGENSNKSMAFSVGKCVIGVSDAIDELKPDLLLVEGDRVEALASAIAAATMNLPVVHVSGGDVSKSIDDSLRHAITKIAHIHLPGTKNSAERILKMGEESWRVFMVGTPINKNFLSKEETEKRLRVEISKNTILVVQHPVSTQSKNSVEQVRLTLEAIKELGFPAIVVYPNSDAGSEGMIGVIDKYKKFPNFRVFKNLSGDLFMSLLKYCSVIVGNSSAGIVEAPFFNTPCVNIGIRQSGREKGGNVIDVLHNKSLIIDAIKKAFSASFRKKVVQGKNPYKSSDVEKKICDVLEKICLDTKLLNKGITY